jgi:multidrug transporter EmrE-like cation transporter
MARLLTILFVGLICEAIGVVFLSRGLKEIIWFFSDREIRVDSLASKLISHGDPVSTFIWEKLTPKQRAELTAANSLSAEKRRALVKALNKVLLEGPIYHEERFARVPLHQEARALAAQQPQGNELLRLNRLLLQDAYPAELAKAEAQTVSPSQIRHLIGRGVTNEHILLGVFFEALFFVCLLMLMSKADVSFVWPLTSLSFVVTTVAAKIYLHEHVSGLRWSGVCLIMMGAALITWTEKRTDSASSHSPGVESSNANTLLPR